MMAVEIFKEVVDLGRTIYQVSRHVAGNREQCVQLGDRIQLIFQTLERLENEYTDKQYVKSLETLYDSLKKCMTFLDKFSGQNAIINILLAGFNQEDFDGLMNELNVHIQQLQLEIQINDAINTEKHTVSQKQDLELLKQQQGSIVDLLLQLVSSQQTSLANRNNLEWMMLEKLTTIHLQLAQHEPASLTNPPPAQTLSAEQLYQEGKEKTKAKNFSGALENYLAAAKQEHVGAQCRLGILLVEQTGIPQSKFNIQQGYYWLSKSAKHKYIPAQYSLAVFLEKNRGDMPADILRAIYWYHQVSLCSSKNPAEINLIELAKRKLILYDHITIPSEKEMQISNMPDLVLNILNKNLPETPLPTVSSAFVIT